MLTVIRIAAVGTLGYLTPRVLVGVGVPLDEWAVVFGTWLGAPRPWVEDWGLTTVAVVCAIALSGIEAWWHPLKRSWNGIFAKVRSISSAAPQAPFRDWNIYDAPIYEAVEYIAEQFEELASNECYPETRQKIRQAALNGNIRIWGRKSDRIGGGRWSLVWTLIEPQYWEQAEIWQLATSKDLADSQSIHAYRERFDNGRYGDEVYTYSELQVNWSEILKYWPKNENSTGK